MLKRGAEERKLRHNMTLKDQLDWEAELLQRGSARYWEHQEKLRKGGEAHQTDSAQFIIKQRLQTVADNIEELAKKGHGKNGKYAKILRTVANGDYLKVAFIGLQVVFSAIREKRRTVLKTTIHIGTRLEADLKCQMFQAKYPAYYNTVEASMKDQNVSDYMHKHKVFMTMFNRFDELEWENIEPSVLSHIGLRVLDGILAEFSDLLYIDRVRTGKKTTAHIMATKEFDEWVEKFEHVKGLLAPAKLPLKIPPQAWDSSGLGGYYSPQMKSTTPFVKAQYRDHREFIKDNEPKQHKLAVNKLQRTAWKVNERVLTVQQEIYNKRLGVGLPSNVRIEPREFPPHLKDVDKEHLNAAQKEEIKTWKHLAKDAYNRERERQAGVICFMQAFKLAQELRSWDEFYYTYTCDFRGRIYCATAGLSPQGADTAKGLIQFAKAERLGPSGIKWLAIQGANTFGNDKLSYADRVSWVKECEGFIRRTVEDPISSREWWGNADKPYQFLAFCFEWADCDYGRNADAKSSIPVGLDGSCNGLQHFSAMLRDEVGASATNLTEGTLPQDIYQEVADVCTEKLRAMDDPRARKWLQVGITRKLAKRPVMTLPYGAKLMSARGAILEWTVDNWELFKTDDKFQWELVRWLAPVLWESISDVVIAARGAMDWLVKNTGQDYTKWLTPIGFPVYQYYKTVESIRINTQLCGMTKLYVDDYDCYGEPATVRQKSGIAPNFIHSIDSTHMVMTINMTDFSSYAMIHDDYGTHAGNTEILANRLRKAFYILYDKNAPLTDWAIQVGVDPTTQPETGTYEIKEIITASYFFG